nr:hypothetical protein [Tanacetum cinerariifolium]
MSRDVLTVGSTMRIPLMYRGEYPQWVERFMNYLEEQTDGEAMINSMKNDDQPLPRVTQVSIAGTLSAEQPPLKDKSMCNKIAKDLWDACARHMLGFEYGEQDRKAAVLYEYETFKATEGELLLDTCIRYLQSANKKQEFVKTDDKKVKKKDNEKKRDMSKVKCYNCKKEGHFVKDCKKVKVKDYEYYKTKMLLAKKDKDEQVLLAEDQAWMESSSDSDQEINVNMVFMAQIEKVLSDLEASSSSADDKISEKKANLETIESLKSKDFESSENAISKSENQSENDCQVVEKECDQVENSNVIAPGMFKLSVSPSVSPISMLKTSYVSKNVENKTKRKRHLDTFSSVRRPKQSSVIWKKKGSSNTSNVDLSSVSY